MGPNKYNQVQLLTGSLIGSLKSRMFSTGCLSDLSCCANLDVLYLLMQSSKASPCTDFIYIPKKIYAVVLLFWDLENISALDTWRPQCSSARLIQLTTVFTHLQYDLFVCFRHSLCPASGSYLLQSTYVRPATAEAQSCFRKGSSQVRSCSLGSRQEL